MLLRPESGYRTESGHLQLAWHWLQRFCLEASHSNVYVFHWAAKARPAATEPDQ